MDVDLSPWFSADDVARGTLNARASLVIDTIAFTIDSILLISLSFSDAGRRLWRACEDATRGLPLARLRAILGDDGLAGAAFLALTPAIRSTLLLPTTLAEWQLGRHLGTVTEGLGSLARREGVAVFASAVLLVPLGLVLGTIRRRLPRSWWWLVAAFASVAVVADAITEPLWMQVDYEVTPLPEGALRSRIEALAKRNHLETGPLFVIDASRYGTGSNAFTTGFGPTLRLVFTDTLLELGDEAVAGAAAHEIGHRRGDRLPLRLALSVVGLGALLYLVERLLRRALARGASSAAHALPFVMAAVSLAMFSTRPARAAFSRAEEREADAVELSERRDYDAYVDEQVRMARTNASNLRRSAFDELLASHPSVPERISTALWYKKRTENPAP